MTARASQVFRNLVRWLSVSCLDLVRESSLVHASACADRRSKPRPPRPLARADTQLRAGDRLILYGRTQRISELEARVRSTGEAMHEEAVGEHTQVVGAELTRAGR